MFGKGKLPISLFIVFSVIFTVFLNSETASLTNGLNIAFDFDPMRRILTVSIKNEYTNDISIYKAFDSAGERPPSFLWVRISKEDGRILSKGELSEDGFITTRVFDSDLIRTPVTLTPILPNQTISFSVKLDKLIAGTERYVHVKMDELKGNCLTFKVRLYLDQALEHFVEQESAPICID